ncbi:MAG: type II toxin-antitoxin system Phd/YefM family antitoxin [Roseiarcus sp.]
MEISITEAERDLAELVRRAEAGEQVVLTRNGHPAACITPITKNSTEDELRRALAEIQAAAAANVISDGMSAARSQDLLYGEDGLPA